MLESWNSGRRKDERLLVQGTQTRAPPRAGIPSPHYSNIPVEVTGKSCSLPQNACPQGNDQKT
jgi:hypothetical protein